MPRGYNFSSVGAQMGAIKLAIAGTQDLASWNVLNA